MPLPGTRSCLFCRHLRGLVDGFGGSEMTGPTEWPAMDCDKGHWSDGAVELSRHEYAMRDLPVHLASDCPDFQLPDNLT